MPSGMVVEVDTIDELFAIDLRIRGSGVSSKGSSLPAAPTTIAHAVDQNSEAWAQFVELVAEPKRIAQLKILSAVKSLSPKAMTLPEMMQLLGVSSGNGVGGVIAGITKNLHKLGIRESEVIIRGADRSLRAGPQLLASALPEVRN